MLYALLVSAPASSSSFLKSSFNCTHKSSFNCHIHNPEREINTVPVCLGNREPTVPEWPPPLSLSSPPLSLPNGAVFSKALEWAHPPCPQPESMSHGQTDVTDKRTQIRAFRLVYSMLCCCGDSAMLLFALVCGAGLSGLTWSKAFLRAILLVTSLWARWSFSCSRRKLVSWRRRFSCCQWQTYPLNLLLLHNNTITHMWGFTFIICIYISLVKIK